MNNHVKTEIIASNGWLLVGTGPDQGAVWEAAHYKQLEEEVDNDNK